MNDIWNVLGVGRFAGLETSTFPQLANKNCIFVEVLPRFIHLGTAHRTGPAPRPHLMRGGVVASGDGFQAGKFEPQTLQSRFPVFHLVKESDIIRPPSDEFAGKTKSRLILVSERGH